MLRKMTLTLCLMGSCVWCLALVAGADSGEASGGRVPFKPVAPVESLMHGQKTFFNEIGAALDNPSFPERSEAIEEAAEVLAELANVNRLNKDKDDYRTWATELRDTALQLAHEAGKENDADETRMRKLLRQIKGICQSCHDVYQ